MISWPEISYGTLLVVLLAPAWIVVSLVRSRTLRWGQLAAALAAVTAVAYWVGYADAFEPLSTAQQACGGLPVIRPPEETLFPISVICHFSDGTVEDMVGSADNWLVYFGLAGSVLAAMLAAIQSVIDHRKVHPK